MLIASAILLPVPSRPVKSGVILSIKGKIYHTSMYNAYYFTAVCIAWIRGGVRGGYIIRFSAMENATRACYTFRHASTTSRQRRGYGDVRNSVGVAGEKSTVARPILFLVVVLSNKLHTLKRNSVRCMTRKNNTRKLDGTFMWV